MILLTNDFMFISGKNRIRVSNCVKSFWDTDLESDMETENIPTWKIYKPMSITNKGMLNFFLNSFQQFKANIKQLSIFMAQHI